MVNNSTPTLIYIVAKGHSGSTMLELLLGGHSAITGIGEVKGLYPKRPPSIHKPLRCKRCNCGEQTPLDCSFWQQIDSLQQSTHGFGLKELDLNTTHRATFITHNQALFNSVATVSNCHFIVDGSKNHQRLAQLLAAGTFHIKTIHLLRKPAANVYSHMRKGSSLSVAAKNWTWDYLHTRQLLRHTDHYPLNYEDLVANPSAIMASLMNWLELDFDEKQLLWNQSIPHRIGGNRRVRMSTDSRIVLDQRWRNALSLKQKATIHFKVASYYSYYWIRSILNFNKATDYDYFDS